MFTSSLLAASALLLLAITTARADSTPYSKFVNDANSILAAATGKDAAQLDALYSWQATQTAVPSADIDSQYQDYLDAYITTTSAPLPAWVTALPSSLQPVMTSFLEAEASLVVQDIAPIVSQADESASAYYYASQTTPTATSSSNGTIVATPAPSVTASSGFATLSANSTTAQVSGSATPSANSTITTAIASNTTAGSSPTRSVTPPTSTQPKGGANKQAGSAGVAAIVGVLGMMLLL